MEVPPKRLIIALAIVFFLGVIFSYLNGYYMQTRGEQIPTIAYLLSFVSLMLGAGLVLLVQKRTTDKQVRSLLRILPENERKIIEILLENKKGLEQNKIVALSEMHKVKVSRTLSKLEKRNVIKKTPVGNTNYITLKI